MFAAPVLAGGHVAETPLWVYGVVGVSTPAALVVLSVLYGLARQDELDAYLRKHGPAPRASYVPPDTKIVETIERVLFDPALKIQKLKRTQIYEHLKSLRDAGAIEPMPSGSGYLLVLRNTEVGFRQQCEPIFEQRGVRHPGLVESTESGIPDWPSTRVRHAGLTGPPESGMPDDPDTPVRHPGFLTQSQSGIPDFRLAINQLIKEHEQFSMHCMQCINNFIQRKGKTRRERAYAFLVILGAFYTPSDWPRRLASGDPAHLHSAETLLGVTLGPQDDVFDETLADERFEYCLGVCWNFASICRTNWQEQEKFWGPRMLSMVRGEKSKMSPWEALEATTKRWCRELESQRQADVVARTQEQAAVQKRLDELKLATTAALPDNDYGRYLQASGHLRPRDHHAELAAAQEAVQEAMAAGRAPTLAEVNAAVEAAAQRQAATSCQSVSLTEAEERRVRSRGRSLEAGARRIEADEIEIRSAIGKALLDALRAKQAAGGQTLSTSEKQQIEAQVRALRTPSRPLTKRVD